MESLFLDFGAAQMRKRGYELSNTLSPNLDTVRLRAVWNSCDADDVKSVVRRYIQNSTSGPEKLVQEEVQGWTEVFAAYWKAVGELLAIQDPPSTNGLSTRSSWTRVYDTWKEMLSALIRGYNTYGFEAWTIPCLYVAGKYLRVFAIKADAERNSGNSHENGGAANFQDDFNPESEQNEKLEDCARQLNRVFNLCLSDRAPLDESRKWGIYHVINLLFKTYFKLNSASLSKNILKALSAGRGDMPDLSVFPASQQVTFKYYEGVLYFLEENYVEAEKHLTEAWGLCHKDAMRNKELILTYLIPCHLLTTHTLPTQRLLERYPRLQKFFLPLAKCIKRGELHAFDLALQEGEDEFVKRRIYLTLERGRDIALRNLLRKVFIAGGFEEPKEPGGPRVRRTRIPIAEFAAAISLGSQETLDNDEVECLLANMIYKVSQVLHTIASPTRRHSWRVPLRNLELPNLMKGYIARERGILVLSKNGAFPGTGV
ncbi:protein CSN12 [Bombardia bombarda]|uniref:Protein CSN12 n=1 Tax=Bombardia bombarda TaxID=252184 RepID=A0AA40BYD1_9PEZI|nr:protein CSN12 [Bombardia bombarda]